MTDQAVYVEAPTEYTDRLACVFLAGGITDCPDWQAVARADLADLPAAVLNPRRANFPIHDPTAARTQIEWEFRHLMRADVTMFWFPASGSTTQPIALYELGRYAAIKNNVVVGADPTYVRRQDVLIQMELARPDIPVLDSYEATVQRTWKMLRNLT